MAEPSPRVDVGRLAAEHLPVVYRYAYRLTGSTVDAEDLTQETFLSAQRHADQLRSGEAARGWLLAICRNNHLKSVRRRRPVSAGSVELQLDQCAAPPPVPEALVEPAQLQVALDALPDESRMVLLLFYFEELSYKQIASALAIPVGTVMSRLSRAKQCLRQRLLAMATRNSVPAEVRTARAQLPLDRGGAFDPRHASQGPTR